MRYAFCKGAYGLDNQISVRGAGPKRKIIERRRQQRGTFPPPARVHLFSLFLNEPHAPSTQYWVSFV
jgi:hypothetical protein